MNRTATLGKGAAGTHQEIRTMNPWRSRALALVFALLAPAAAYAQNAIQSITSTQDG